MEALAKPQHSPRPAPRRRDQEITPDQMRDARVLLGWSRERLGALAEVSANFIAIYERHGRAMSASRVAIHPDQMGQVRKALEAAGIEFTISGSGHPGIRLSGLG